MSAARECAALARELHGHVAKDARGGVGSPAGMGIAQAVRHVEPAHEAQIFAHGEAGEGEKGVVDRPGVAAYSAHHVRG